MTPDGAGWMLRCRVEAAYESGSDDSSPGVDDGNRRVDDADSLSCRKEKEEAPAAALLLNDYHPGSCD